MASRMGPAMGKRLQTNFSDEEFEVHVVLLSKSKLKSSMRTSTLLAGFALVAMVEVDLHPKTPAALLIPFAMHTAILIFVHLFSLMIATQILPELEAASAFAQPHINPAAVKIAKSWPVQVCWVLSNMVGIVLFAVELVLVAYVKFYPVDDSVKDRLHVGTGTLVIVVLMSLFSVPFILIFFRSISKQKIQLHEASLRKAKELLDNINQATATSDKDSWSVDSYHTSGSPGHTENESTEV